MKTPKTSDKTPALATPTTENAMKNTPANSPVTAPVTAPAKMPAFTPYTALAELWDVAAKGMPADKLAWFASGAASEVTRQTRQLSTVVEGLSCLIDSDENCGSFQHKSDLTTLLFSVSNHLSGIAGLAHVAEFAASELHYAAVTKEGKGV